MAMLLQPEDRQKLEARLYVRVWCPGVPWCFSYHRCLGCRDVAALFLLSAVRNDAW